MMISEEGGWMKRKYKRKYHKKNREKINSYQKEYTKAHPDNIVKFFILFTCYVIIFIDHTFGY